MSAELIRKIPAVVVALDSMGNIEEMSESFLQWCRSIPQLGDNIANTLHDDIYMSLKEQLSIAIGGTYMELTIEHPVGSKLLHRVCITSTSRGCILLANPINQAKDLDIDQLKLQSLLRVTLDTIDQGIAIYDEDLCLVTWNVRFETMAIHPPGMIASGISLLACYKKIAEAGVFGPGDPAEQAQEHIDIIRTRRMKTVEDLHPPTGKTILVNRYYLSGGGICATFTDVTEQRKSEQKLLYQAHHDFLTGCINRQHIISKTDMQIDKVDNSDHEPFYFLFIDLDRFKFVNDTFGHNIGDKLLQDCAERIKQQINPNQGDCLARLGGDEFLLLVTNPAAYNNIQKFTSKLLNIISTPYDCAGNRIHISSSIGICHYPSDRGCATDLIAKADIAMYQAKLQGRNCFHFYNKDMGEAVNRRTLLANQLHEDTSKLNGFYLQYQPVIDLQSGEIVSAEALLRWNNHILGEVSPAEFIPIAEETGDIIQLGRFVIESACKTLHELSGINNKLRIAINVSPLQVAQTHLSEIISNALLKYNIDAKNLTVEITESGMIEEIQEVNDNLLGVRALGCDLAIDDFGTGYSSLSYVRKYPFTYIKIDRFFVKDLEENSEHASLVKAIVDMASAFQLKVVAEGIETPGQNDFLRDINCTYAQGYYHSRPIPKDTFTTLVSKKQRFELAEPHLA